MGQETSKSLPYLGSYCYSLKVARNHNVTIGAGAKITENVIIGEGARVGANCVVIEKVPSNLLAVGVPARIVKNVSKNEKLIAR